jgi:hypothetical protein
VLVALVLPSSAFGQATRTWVSGVGDDVNPCSRTAPCKTFAGAISKTAIGGIIDVLDDGGFGALTITKAITVDGGHHTAGVLASGGINAIQVNAGVNDKVVLRNLDIEGNGTTLGLNGVRVIQAGAVKIYNNDIGFFSRSGVLMDQNAGVVTKLLVQGNRIHDNGGNGVTVAPLNTANGKTTLRNNTIDDNACGVLAATNGMSNVFTSGCGANPPGASAGRATINMFDNSIEDATGDGVFSRGSMSTIRLSGNEINNVVNGLNFSDGGQVLSFGNNSFAGNSSNGTPTGPNLTFTKRFGR